MTEITIKRLVEEDWEALKTIRLQALQQNSDVFLSNYDKEVQYDAARWKSNLSDKSGATFGLFDKNKIIGVTGVFTWKGDETGETAIACMSFIEQGYRGKGYSKLFYEARITWAREQDCFDKIRVSHRQGNEASRVANQAFGFQLINKEMIKWPDGTKDFEYNYELNLRR